MQMAEYPTEEEDYYYADDFEDDEDPSSRPTTTATSATRQSSSSSRVITKGPVQVTASAAVARANVTRELDSEGSFSSYHTSDEDGGDTDDEHLQALLGLGRGKKKSTKKNDHGAGSDEEDGHDGFGQAGGRGMYPTEAAAAQRPALAAIETSEERDPFAHELGDTPSPSSSSSTSSVTPSTSASPQSSAPAAPTVTSSAAKQTTAHSSYTTTPGVSPVERTEVSHQSQPSETAVELPKQKTSSSVDASGEGRPWTKDSRDTYPVEPDNQDHKTTSNTHASSSSLSSTLSSRSETPTRAPPTKPTTSSSTTDVAEGVSHLQTPPSQRIPGAITRSDVSSPLPNQRHALASASHTQNNNSDSNVGGLVHRSNITSVEMIESEGDRSGYRGHSNRPVDEDEEDEREIRTGSVADNLPLAGRLRPIKKPHAKQQPESTEPSQGSQRNLASNEKRDHITTGHGSSAANSRTSSSSSSSSSSSASSRTSSRPTPSALPSSSERTPVRQTNADSTTHSAASLTPHEKKLSTVTPSQSDRRTSDNHKSRGRATSGADDATNSTTPRRRRVNAQAGPSPERAERFKGEYNPYGNQAENDSSPSSSPSSQLSRAPSVPAAPTSTTTSLDARTDSMGRKLASRESDGVMDSGKPPIMKTPTPRTTPREISLISERASHDSASNRVYPTESQAADASGIPAPWSNNEEVNEGSSHPLTGRRASDLPVGKPIPSPTQDNKRKGSSPSRGGAVQPASRKQSDGSAPMLSPNKVIKPRSSTAAPNSHASNKRSSSGGGGGPRRSSSASSTGDSSDSAAEKAALVDRIEDLKRHVVAWHRRIEAKERQVGRLRRRYYGEDDDDEVDEKNPPGTLGGRRASREDPSLRGAPGARKRNGPAKTKKQQRLAQLRKENRELEAKHERYSGQIVNVAFLVARLDEQLYRFQNKLKELQALRRALDNRDKRAAHTIEEVHRRMPSKDQLRDRQLNEGIYGQTVLERRVREIRQQIAKTTQSHELMSAKCAELEEEVKYKEYTATSTRDYEQLKDTSETNAKRIEKLKAAIAVYTNAVNTITNPSGSRANGPSSSLHPDGLPGRRGSMGSHTNTSTAVTTPTHAGAGTTANSPQKKSRTGKVVQQLRTAQRRSTLYGADHAHTDEAEVFVQRESVAERRRLLEEQLADLEAKIAQRASQIEANAQFVQRNTVGDVSSSLLPTTRSANEAKPSLSPVSQSSSSAARAAAASGKTSDLLFGPATSQSAQRGVGPTAHPALTAEPVEEHLPNTTEGGVDNADVFRGFGSGPHPNTSVEAQLSHSPLQLSHSGKRIISGVSTSGSHAGFADTATLERMGNEADDANGAASGRAEDPRDLFNLDRARKEAEKHGDEDALEDSVDEVLRAIDQDSKRLLGSPHGVPGRTGAANVDAVSDEQTMEEVDETVGSDAGGEATREEAPSEAEGLEEEESVADAEEAGESGRSTPLWLR